MLLYVNVQCSSSKIIRHEVSAIVPMLLPTVFYFVQSSKTNHFALGLARFMKMLYFNK
jgi:hypothetical protein